ncbi:Bug family tripartite tricarboxylate transporter substrate binding protein [Muricoccus radiodurans]|uniref:Bug family tripartite tricarboxylate transporter substrate binding protein n=1 Tax=Muricoccus radiodurans TaxID=2231721 RepID=UPI003CF376C0
MIGRRTLLGTTLALPALARPASAQAPAGPWPQRPIRIIITYPPGGTTDFVARVFAQHMSGTLGQSVVVENRPGGGGVVGWQAVVRSPPDGYTLLLTENSLATAPPLYPNLGFDVRTDFTPVSLLVDYAVIFAVPASSPARDLRQFIAMARERGPDGVFYGTMGAGSSPHLYTEVLQDLTGARMTHVPYRGMGPALNDLLAGRVSILPAAPPTVMGAIQGGQLRALAISTPGGRIPSLPDVPTLKELGIDFTSSYWYGLLGPRGLEPAVVARLQEAVRQTLAVPEIRDRFVEQGAIPVGGDGTALKAVMDADLDRWTVVIREKNITLNQ